MRDSPDSRVEFDVETETRTTTRDIIQGIWPAGGRMRIMGALPLPRGVANDRRGLIQSWLK